MKTVFFKDLWPAVGRWPSGRRLCAALLGAATMLAASSAMAATNVNVKTLTGGWWQYNTKTFYGNTNGNTFAVAQFNYPSGLALDPSGTSLFVADCTNNAVRLISNLSNEVISATTTFVSTNKGISRPVAVAVDGATNLYVLNRGNGNNGTVIEFDGVWGLPIRTNAVNLTNATAMALDRLTNLYVTIKSNTVIRISPAGVITNVGVITNAGTSLRGITISDYDQLALTDAGNHGIWLLNPNNGTFTNLTGFHGAGDVLGPRSIAAFNRPEMIAQAGGGMLVVADRGNHKVKMVDASGTVTRLYGVSSNLWVPGPSTLQNPIFPGWWDGDVWPDETVSGSVEARDPLGVLVAPDGSVYTTEVYYHIIRHTTGTELTGPSTEPPFNGPRGLALDKAANFLFIADYTNNAVRKLNLSDNQTTTFIGGLKNPVAVVLDPGDNVYVLNQGIGTNDGSLAVYTPAGNLITNLVSDLKLPTALTMDANTNLYVTELNGVIKRVPPNGGPASDFATITNVAVQLQGIAIMEDGTMVVSDALNHRLWIVGLGGGTNTVVGFLTGYLNQPHHLLSAAGSDGTNLLVVANSGNDELLVVDLTSGTIKTNLSDITVSTNLSTVNPLVWFGRSDDPVGPDSPRYELMNYPRGVAVSPGGALFSSERNASKVRRLRVTTLAGIAGPGTLTNPSGSEQPRFNGPLGIALDTAGTSLYVAGGPSNVVFKLSFGDNVTAPFVTTNMNQPVAVAVDPVDNLYVLNQGNGTDGYILKFNKFGNFLGTNATTLTNATALALDGSTNMLVAELGGNIKRIPPAGGSGTVIATVTNAGVQLQGIVVEDDGTLAVSDSGNHAVFLINPVSYAVSVLTGNNGPGSTIGTAPFAQLNQPHHLAKAGGGILVVADFLNDRVSVVDNTGTATRLASTNSQIWFGRTNDPVSPGSSRFVQMKQPEGIVVAPNGDIITAELFYHNIRRTSNTGLTGPGGGSSGTNGVVITPPTISPNTGYYPMGQIITVGSPNPNVFYTTDGSEPTTNSARVTIIGNTGFIRWVNTTNDLTALSVRAFVSTNASVTVRGLPATTNNVGVPSGLFGNLHAGIGSTVVIPVVANLRTNDQIMSYQFKVEITPNGSAPMISDQFRPLSVASNDFIRVITSAQGDAIATISVSPYTIGNARGLEITAIGTNANVFFERFAIVAMLAVPIPGAAQEGDTYSINVLNGSATSDGVSSPVAFPSMPDATILVTNVAYTVGDSAPSGWYNAGEFGNTNLDNSDVNNAFYAAAGLRLPYPFSDVYNTMDAYPEDEAGFVGGDGEIRFLDWQVILQRSLRQVPYYGGTNNWMRAWLSGGDRTNFMITLPAGSPDQTDGVTVGAPWNRQAKVGAISVGNAFAGGQVNVPVYVRTAWGATLAGLQFRCIVTPDNGGPVLTAAPTFIPVGGLAAPIQQSFQVNEFACGWSLNIVNGVNCAAHTSNYLGTVRFTIPQGAVAGQTYTVAFANADGAPDIHTQYTFETKRAAVAVGTLPPVTDIISDDWKVHFFADPNADPNADPDHDGVPNWAEYVAGTDPTDGNSRLKCDSVTRTVSGERQVVLNWLSAPGKAYQVLVAGNPGGTGGWSVLGTISGDGHTAQYIETNPTGARFYRLRVLP